MNARGVRNSLDGVRPRSILRWIFNLNMIPRGLLRALLFPGFGLLVLYPLSLFADTLILRDGSELKGKVLSQTQFSIRVQTDAGPRVVAKSNIRRLVYGDLPKKEEAKKPVAPEPKKLEPVAKKPASAAARSTAASGDFKGNIARSMILPGWGQIHAGQTGKGAVFAGLYLAAIGATASARAGVDAARVSYNDPLPFLMFRGAGSGGLLAGNFIYGQRFSELNAARFELSLVFAAGVWLANMIDVVFFSNEKLTSFVLPYALDAERGALAGFQLRW